MTFSVRTLCLLAICLSCFADTHTNYNGASGTANISGGAINGATIGATTPSTGAFTTLSASSTVSGTGFNSLFASPPAIGSTVAGTGAFTTLEAVTAMGVGAASQTNSGLTVKDTPSTGTTAYGILNQPTAGSTATAGFIADLTGVTTVASLATGTIANHECSDVTIGSGGTLTNSICLWIPDFTSAATNKWGIYSTMTSGTGKYFIDHTGTASSTFGGPIYAAGGLYIQNMVFSQTAPTISSGFCSSPSIAAANGSSTFTMTIGTSCAAATGVLTLPTATNGWHCIADDLTNPNSYIIRQTAKTMTSVTLTAYSASAPNTTSNWTASDVLIVSCFAY